ncbi:unnamed protein product [Clonostachys rosea]|uniref:Uncharacterized protein n=1 Tax=Bionectria ochroleuca TaxID=29856 RepID=A0ABY6U171_BIOOC|nr:unnamed protein product [Clonostachys rosea]
MVCIKQVSIPAVVLLSIAEQAAAAPVARRSDIVARDAPQAVESIDLAIRDLELDERGIASKIFGVIKKNPGKTFDRTLSSANTAMTVANTHKTVSGKRDLEEEIELALRDLDIELDERGFGKLIKGAASKVMGVIKKNPGKTFDRTLSSANTAMTVANTHKTVSGKRDLGDVEERDIEEEIELALRDFDLELGERGLLKKVLTPIVKATKAVTGNKGKTFDRVLSTANTGMAIANTHKTQTSKRDLDELEERDIEEEVELALRDLDLYERSLLKKVLTPIVKATKAVTGNKGKTFDRVLSTANTGMTIANTHKTQTSKRDLEDIEERDWEEIEERDDEELDERDWDDMIEERDVEELDERDINDLEVRAGLLGVAKKVAKGALGAMDIISKNQGKSYNRANAAANSAMKVAQTKKKQEKRDFEERDFEYLNSLSQRDLEDLELAVRALYGDYLEDY